MWKKMANGQVSLTLNDFLLIKIDLSTDIYRQFDLLEFYRFYAESGAIFLSELLQFLGFMRQKPVF